MKNLTRALAILSMLILVSCGDSEQEKTADNNSVIASKIETQKAEESSSEKSTVVEKEPVRNIAYEDLPQQSKDEIKQMMDVIVLYILQKGPPKGESGDLSPAAQKAYFDNELILGIDEEILPAYPNVDFTGMKKLILLGE